MNDDNLINLVYKKGDTDINPSFDIMLRSIFPWSPSTEHELLQGISDKSSMAQQGEMSWFDSWRLFRSDCYVKMGYKQYLVPRANDTEVSFIDSINMIFRGIGVSNTITFNDAWALWRKEVESCYWVYNSGQCKCGFNIDSKSGKHTVLEDKITNKYTEITGISLTGYETSVCGCGTKTCCNPRKIYVYGHGFFFKDDACYLGILSKEDCKSPKCNELHGSIYKTNAT